MNLQQTAALYGYLRMFKFEIYDGGFDFPVRPTCKYFDEMEAYCFQVGLTPRELDEAENIALWQTFELKPEFQPETGLVIQNDT